jgi:hypothetical protein
LTNGPSTSSLVTGSSFFPATSRNSMADRRKGAHSFPHMPLYSGWPLRIKN